MIVRALTKRAFNYVLLSMTFALLLMLSTSATVKASEDVLTEIRYLLQTQYVEPVSREVLNASTVEEMLERLGDPHTRYFTPEEYQEFVESIDMSFTGIGIHMEMLPEGVLVLSAITGSPAEEAGLKLGDIIISADGKSLVGLSSDEALNLLRGPEGSTVMLRVEQGTVTRNIPLTRRAVTVPTVTGKVLSGHIGYLDLNSFGDETPGEFETLVNQLNKQNVDSWIVDLRDNGGGYLSSALDLTSYFIGSDIAVRIKDRTGTLHPYRVKDPGWRMDQRIIVLINENSASASEILAAALKDYDEATLVGTTTYGKGTVQTIFPLENGGVLKMTVDHFYSPQGHEIDKVGVSPDVVIQTSDSLRAAELMLSDSAEAFALARTEDYWETWGELSGENYFHYYANYQQVAELSDVSLNKKFIVNFSGEINWESVNNSSMELINSRTGERTLVSFKPLSTTAVQVIPDVELAPGTTYWLVIHPTILGVSGQTLQEGGVAIVRTIKGDEEAEGIWKVQSFRVNDRVSEGNRIRPGDPDYGQAIKDVEEKQ